MTNRTGLAATAPRRPPSPPIAWVDTREIVVDPADLNGAQRSGDACVTCSRRWPRPRVEVATIPAGDKVRACRDCAPYVTRQIRQDAVQTVLARAAEDVQRYAPNALCALISSAPYPYGDGPRHVVETAAVVVARHIAATADLGGAQLLPAEIGEWGQAHPWLNAWATTGPSAAAIREVLTAVIAGLPDTLHDMGPGGR